MGNFYCNFTTHGPSGNDIIRILESERRSAFISPTLNDRTTIYERASDDLSEREIDVIGTLLSRELNCPALAAIVADDDVLWLFLYEGGVRKAEYNSRGANRGAYAICRAFERTWLTPLMWVLLQCPYMIFETLRHLLVAKLLRIPLWSVGSGYKYLLKGEIPHGIVEGQLRRVGPGT